MISDNDDNAAAVDSKPDCSAHVVVIDNDDAFVEKKISLYNFFV